MFYQQQQSQFPFQGGIGNAQQPSVKDINDLYNDLSRYHEHLDKSKEETKKEIKSIDERMEFSKKQLKETCTKKKNQQQKVVSQPDPPGSLMDWVESDVKSSVTSSIQNSQDKNKEIMSTLLVVHQMMENYSQQNHKMQKNTSKELQLLKELENMREQLQAQQFKLQEVSNHFEFNEVNPKIGQIRKNKRVKEFDDQSYELMNKLKNDYYHSKILLEKNREQMETMKKTLDDGK